MHDVAVLFVAQALGTMGIGFISPMLPTLLTLSSPNDRQGSNLGVLSAFGQIARFFGPTALALETGEDAWPKRLGNADFPLGIIMGGTRIGMPITSRMLPGSDDGIVSAESGKLEGMHQLIQVRSIHTSLPVNPAALEQAQHFLEQGEFSQLEAHSAKPRSSQKWFKSLSPKRR